MPANLGNSAVPTGLENVSFHSSLKERQCQRVLKVKKVKEVKSLSRVRLFATPWTVAYQASLSMELSRQGYWSGLPFPSPGGLPDPGIEPRSPTLQADTLPSEPPGKPKSQLKRIYFLTDIFLSMISFLSANYNFLFNFYAFSSFS